MSNELSSVEPLEASEYEAFIKLLVGEQPELELLRYQVQSVCYASEFYRPRRLLGIKYRPHYVSRRPGETGLAVQWGMGGEDWMLGDRRQYRVNDLVACLRDGTLAQLELVVEKGLVSRLHVVGGWSNMGERLARSDVDLKWREVEAFLFFDGENPGTSTQDRLPGKDLAFSPPPLRDGMTEWKSWFEALGDLSIRPPTVSGYQPQIPLRIRRAWPASTAEINHLEDQYGVRVPEEVRGFWGASNGASLLGWPVCGTYDTALLDWPSEWRLLLIADLYGDGSVIAVETTQKGQATSRQARVFHYSAESEKPLRTWSSLKECFVGLLEEVRREAVGTVLAADGPGHWSGER